MSEPLDLAAIRAHHATVTPTDMKAFSAVAQAAHDDRAALLAALDRVDAALIRADGHRARLLAMLDRLAALTVEEVAQTIADCTPGAGWAPDTGGRVTRIERDMAAAVLALVQARVAGPGAEASR